MGHTTAGTLRCDMDHDCTEPVAMIDNKGYAYCIDHGMRRRVSGIPCRKLQGWERRRLEAGRPLTRY